jgi:hypothetical protein
MMRASKPLRDLVASLSLANLMFLRLWMKLLPYQRGSGYLLAFSPRNSYLALMLNVLLWGGTFFLLLRLGRGSKRIFPALVLALFCLVSIAALYGVGLSYTSTGKLLFLFGASKILYLEIASACLGLTGLILMLRYRERLAGPCLVLSLFFAPFLPVTFGQSLLALARMEPAARFHPHQVDPAAPLRNPLKTSVVWMIFDETDYRICFQKRPAGLALPAFDRLRSQALWATSAYSPSDATMVSLPALLTGIPLKSAAPAGAERLELVRADPQQTRLDFAAQETIFDRVKKRLGSTALFGWYHPYGRLMHGVDLCRDYPRYNFSTSDSLCQVLLMQWAEVWDIRFLPFRDTLLAQNHIGIVRGMQSDVLAAVKDQDPSFMFLHYPVPHSPNIYDRKSGSFGFNRNSHEGYLDNMALADRCLGELRAGMERKGSWDGALVVVSSDHHWRTNTYDGQTDFEHVPFLVKLPHQREGASYGGRFNTVLTQDLILAVLDGRVKTPRDVAVWLDQAGKKAPYSKVIFSINQPDAD